MAEVLSQDTCVASEVEMSSLASNCRIHTISVAVEARARYAASVDDLATKFYFFVAQEIRITPRNIQYFCRRFAICSIAGSVRISVSCKMMVFGRDEKTM